MVFLVIAKARLTIYEANGKMLKLITLDELLHCEMSAFAVMVDLF